MSDEGYDSIGFSRLTFALGDGEGVMHAHVADDASPETIAAIKAVGEAAFELLGERCPVCEGIDFPGLAHNPLAEYCTERSDR